MNETTPSGCAITGSIENKNENGPLTDTMPRKKRIRNLFVDLTGRKFHRLLVVGEHFNANRRKHYTSGRWLCKCDCGNERIIWGSYLLTDFIKSCGCFHKELIQTCNRKRPYEWMLVRLRRKSKNRWGSILTYDELLEFIKINKCHYCESDVIWNMYSSCHSKRLSSKYNLDRMDNSLGYSKDNCIVCCSVCNYFKGDRFTYDEMVEIGKTFQKLRKDRLQKQIPWVKTYAENSSPNIL